MMTKITNDVAVNLSNCDQEPIHIPGQIQSHGFLIAVNKELIITHFSENIHDFLPEVPAVLCGLPIGAIESDIGKNEPPNFINQLILFGRNNGFDQTNPFKTDLQGKPFHLIISPSEDNFLLEFEPAVSQVPVDIQKMIGRSISEMLADKNLQNLLNNTAGQIKKVIDYDRVMIYRFAEDGHGEVVAEARNEDLESWLGLHYPASDIPRQARELYKKNFTRLIADVHSTPSRILGLPEQGGQLDLTYSQLRAVSPIHIQYLKNMKVDSSFSISLMYRNELWGLIACHNYSPRFIDYKSRESAKLIGQILSSALEFRQDEENQKVKARFKAAVDELIKLMQKNQSIEEALTTAAITIKDITNATGAVLIYESNIRQLGQTPDLDQLNGLITWFKSEIKVPFYYTDRLSEVYPEASAFANVASGVLITTLSEELGEYVIWFKPEQVQIVNWAGNPEKPVEGIIDDDLLRISPRKSFEVWSQTVAEKSKSWTIEEIQSAMRLKGEIIYSINQRASQIRILNDKLKQAYEELDTFSYTISHDLKNPLSAIKSYSEILLRDKNLPPDSQRMIGRIVAGADKMNTMIREVLEYSRIGNSDIEFVEIEMKPLIDELLKDLKVAYEADHAAVTIGSTPTIKGDPVMISQIFSNLIGNAIKYSGHSNVPSISIEGNVQDDEIVYCVSDNGIGIDIKKITQVFQLFKRLDNAQEFEGSGVGLAIVKRIVEKHKGKIWVESEPGEGSSFFVSFKK